MNATSVIQTLLKPKYKINLKPFMRQQLEKNEKKIDVPLRNKKAQQFINFKKNFFFF